jgi:outer membrane protein TolC
MTKMRLGWWPSGAGASRAFLVVAILAHAGCEALDQALPLDAAKPAVLQSLAPSNHLQDLRDGAATPRDAAQLPEVPATESIERPLPINLASAMQLGNARAVDIAAAAARVRVAAAALEQARVLWLPSVTFGGDYQRHDGQDQVSTGEIIGHSDNSLMVGLGSGIGPSAVLNVGDAIFAPLAARQQLRAREASSQAASNDTLVAVTDAYFNVQQARGELAGAREATKRTAELLRRTQKLSPGLIPDLENDRVEAELMHRQQAELVALEHGKTAGAELARVLRLDPAVQIEPLEPPHLQIDLIDLQKPLDELIPLALLNRPELASQHAQVEATLVLLKQEKLRPFIPSVLLRGYSTPVAGTMAAGYFAGGPNDTVGNGGFRSDFDLQVLWQLDNLGFGNQARVHQRQAENRQAIVELFRMEDKIAAEVAEAHAQAQLALRRVALAEKGIRAAQSSADKNVAALSQTKEVDGRVVLLARPQEALVSVQALAQAYADYYGAVADANRAQFRLYRALGNSAECLLQNP